MRTRLREMISRALDQARNNTIPLLSALSLCVGILVAYSVFQAFSGFVSTVNNNKDTLPSKKPDTVYVKLVDLNKSLAGVMADSNAQKRASAPPTHRLLNRKAGAIPSVDSGDGTNANRRLAGAAPIRSFLKADSIRRIAAAAPQPIEKATGYGSLVYLVLSILGLIIFVILLYNLPNLGYKLDSDKDPLSLASLFDRCGQDIEALDNPRKIKRFSNKLRFQYYYLTNMKIIGDKEPKKQALMASILLYLEKGGQLTDMDKPAEEGGYRSLAWFEKKIKVDILKNESAKIDGRLIEQMYELNKNMIV